MKTEFTTKAGHGALILDEECGGFIPSVNPFGFGCGTCGEYHQVSFKVEGEDMVFNFSKDQEETERLRAHLGPDSLPEKYAKVKQLLESWKAAGQSVNFVMQEVVETIDDAIAAINSANFREAIVHCEAVREMVGQLLPEDKKVERRLVIC